jgi:hypothetical protein
VIGVAELIPVVYSVDFFENKTQTRRGPIEATRRYLGTIQCAKRYLIWGLKAMTNGFFAN